MFSRRSPKRERSTAHRLVTHSPSSRIEAAPERNERAQAHVRPVVPSRWARRPAQRSHERRPTCAGSFGEDARGTSIARCTHLDASASRCEEIRPRLHEPRVVIVRSVRDALAQRRELAFASRRRHVHRAVRPRCDVGLGSLRERPRHSDHAQERSHEQPKPGGAMQHQSSASRAAKSRASATFAIQPRCAKEAGAHVPLGSPASRASARGRRVGDMWAIGPPGAAR